MRDSERPADAPVENAVYGTFYEPLAALLGRLTGRKAIEIACQHSGLVPATLTPADFARVATKLRPMMETLIGHAVTERVLTEIEGRLRRGRQP